MADIKIVDSEGKVVVSEERELTSENNISAPVNDGLMERAIAEVVGIDNETDKSRYADKLSTLLAYAKTQTKDHSPENLKWAIRSLELRLGTPPLAEKRINYVSRYAYLAMESQKIKKEMSSFEHSL